MAVRGQIKVLQTNNKTIAILVLFIFYPQRRLILPYHRTELFYLVIEIDYFLALAAHVGKKIIPVLSAKVAISSHYGVNMCSPRVVLNYIVLC